MSAMPQLLTDRELEIMKVVWALGSATVRQVYEELNSSGERRPRAYTTVMTLMKILVEKGHLRKESEGKAHVFSAVLEKREVLSSMVSEFVQRVFDGAAQPLLLMLVGENELSPTEIEKLLRDLEKER